MLIEAHDLTMSFGSRPAVRGVSLEIPRASIVGLLGSNGAGKSTTMRMLAGTISPDKGRALIDGCDVVCDRLKAQSRVGYLPEAANGFAGLTVGEFLTFAAEARGLVRRDAARCVNAITDRLGLETAYGRLLGSLSKGWRQRAWLGQALIHDPPVLVLDEPTDGLDPKQKADLRGLLAELAREKAILMSTHILEEAETLCSRLIVMRDGLIVRDAPTQELADENGRLAEAFIALTTPASDEEGLAA